MGRQQIEAPWTFHMALAYVCDISSLLCRGKNVCAGELVVHYLLPTSINGIPLHNKVV